MMRLEQFRFVMSFCPLALAMLGCLLSGCNGSTEPEPSTAQGTIDTAQQADGAGNAPGNTGAAASTPQATTVVPVPGLLSGPAAAKQQVAAADKFLIDGQGQKALESLTRAIQSDPRNIEASVKRADLLSRANLLPQAVVDLSRAIEISPDDAKLYNSRGYLLLNLKKYDLSIADFDKAIALDLNYAAPLNNRGLARLAAGEGEKSLPDFDAALRIDPKYIDAKNNRGYVLIQLQRYPEAIETLTEAIAIKDDYINAYNNRGIAHKQAGMFAEAVADFSRAIEMQPTQVRYIAHRKEAYESLGKTAEATADGTRIDWLNELARLNELAKGAPNDADRWLWRAAHLVDGAEYDTALKDLDRALHLNPELAAAYTVRAKIHLAQGDAEKAIQEATRALATKPHHEAYSLRGDAYFAQKNYEAAIADYQSARRLDEQVQSAFRLRAEQLEREGNIQQAGYYREQADGLSNTGATRTEKPVESSRVLPLPTTAETEQPQLN